MTGLKSVCLPHCVSMENVPAGLALVTKTTVSTNLQASFNLRFPVFSDNLLSVLEPLVLSLMRQNVSVYCHAWIALGV